MGRTLARLKFKEKEEREKRRFKEKLVLYLLRLAWGSAKRSDQRIGRCSSNEIHTQKGSVGTDQMVLHQSRFPLRSSHTTQHTPSWGENSYSSLNRLESPSRASVRAAVLLYLGVQSCNKPCVFRDSVRGFGSQ